MANHCKTFGAFLAGMLLFAQAQASTVLNETLTVAPAGNLATSSVFTLGTAGQTLDLVVKASSATSNWVILSFFPVIGPGRSLALEPIEESSSLSLDAHGGGVSEVFTYTGLAAGRYSFDVYGAANSLIHLTADSTVSAVPEATSALYAAMGGLVALMAVKRRRSTAATA